MWGLATAEKIVPGDKNRLALCLLLSASKCSRFMSCHNLFHSDSFFLSPFNITWHNLFVNIFVGSCACVRAFVVVVLPRYFTVQLFIYHSIFWILVPSLLHHARNQCLQIKHRHLRGQSTTFRVDEVDEWNITEPWSGTIELRIRSFAVVPEEFLL
jgi:hypothetical protein